MKLKKIFKITAIYQRTTAGLIITSMVFGFYSHNVKEAEATKRVYYVETAGTSWVVPTSVTSVVVKMWGGGGGGGGGGTVTGGGAGAGAGYITGTVPVTPGETLTVRVGGGGTQGAFSSGGGGALSGDGAGGGGYSALLRSGTILLLAPGGGGGGGGDNTTAAGGAGGVGGGNTGGNAAASGSAGGGFGGSQTAGGNGGTGGGVAGAAGASLAGGNGGNTTNGTCAGNTAGQGGAGGTNGGGAGGIADNGTNGCAGGGGGGGGYYGGGGGSDSLTANAGGGGGGGGSARAGSTPTATTTTSGSGTTAGGSGDSDYFASAGSGGAGGGLSGSGTAGTDGRLVINYTGTTGNIDTASTFLLHMDGADTSTTFTDSCRYPTTFTPAGNAQIDTAQSKFNSASGLFDGTGDYLTATYVPATMDWWKSDYTIDAWIRAGSFDASPSNLIGNMAPASNVDYWSFGPVTSGGLNFYYYNGTGITVSSPTGLISVNTWHHIAMTHRAGTITLYVDGIEVASAAVSGTPQSSAGTQLTVGAYNSGYYAGHIDELRVTYGRALWTDAFEVPTQASVCHGGPSGQTNFTTPVVINESAAVTGALAKGSGTFVIDHPLDPVRKMLFHSFVESPDVKNIYDGIVELDSKGSATIKLPDYFEALNKDYRFLLTPIGQPGPELFIQSNGVVDNEFTIAGGPPNTKVSWQITGIRQDPYIIANPIVNEVMKGRGAMVDIDEYLFEGYNDLFGL